MCSPEGWHTATSPALTSGSTEHPSCLLCLTRLTNHPDIPKQQLPAITSSRTHVPISCTPISSLALDLGQISALGCSRARLLHPRSWRLDGTSPGCRPRGLSSLFPCPHLSFSSLCFYTGTAAPTSPGACAGWEISARDRNSCGVHRRAAMSLPILHKLPGCQKI